MGNVADLAGAVNDHEDVAPTLAHCMWLAAPRGGLRALGRPGVAHVSLALEEHQVVDDAAFIVKQQAVALLAHRQIDHVDRNQALERGGGVGADQAQLAHVRNIKQTGGVARVMVLGHQASRILHRHRVAGKRHHAGTERDMQIVQRCLQKGFRRNRHQRTPVQARGSSQSITEVMGYPPLSALPERFA